MKKILKTLLFIFGAIFVIFSTGCDKKFGKEISVDIGGENNFSSLSGGGK